MKQGRAVVLFDGLDEVNLEGGARVSITNSVRDFTWQYSRNHIVITCRTAATEHLFEGFSYCELADFTIEQMKTFVARWFQGDEAKREAFWKAFEQPENNRLQDLSRRPLLLTMLCLTFEETMAFPNRRAELYEEAIDALLKKWDSSRSIQRDIVYRKLSLGYKRQLLMEIAAETFESGELFMRKQDLVQRVTRFVRRLPPLDTEEEIDDEALLKAIESQHGLLIERAHDIYSFSHLTFHEYFTARYIVENPESKVLYGMVSHAADKRWREVMLLSTSLLNYRSVAHLFNIWCTQLQEYILSNTTFRSVMQEIDNHFTFSTTSLYASDKAYAIMATIFCWISTQIQPLYHIYDDIIATIQILDREDPLAIRRINSLPVDRIKDITIQFEKGIANKINRSDILQIDILIDNASQLRVAIDRISIRARALMSPSAVANRTFVKAEQLTNLFKQVSNHVYDIISILQLILIIEHIQSRINTHRKDVSSPKSLVTQEQGYAAEYGRLTKGFHLERYAA